MIGNDREQRLVTAILAAASALHWGAQPVEKYLWLTQAVVNGGQGSAAGAQLALLK